MRKVLISLLLAGAAATPAIAGPHNWSDNRQQAQSDRQQAQSDRQQAHQERAQARDEARAERSDGRPAFNGPRYQPDAQPRQQMVDRPQFDRQQMVDRPQFDRPDRQPPANVDAMRAQRDAYAAQQRDQRVFQRDQRQQEVRDARDLRQQDRAGPNVMRDRRPPVVSNVPRPGTQPPLRGDANRVAALHWNRNWQHDGDHDWRRYRDHHRSRFHLGFYIDPFGWGYQPFGIGYRMWPAYYGNQYWIDPALYGLPYPPPGCAWVRYWNDAVLVDLYSGTIIDEIPGFFW